MVAVNSTRHPRILIWLQEQGVEILAAAVHDLRPFLDQGLNYAIPGQFRTAHALASYAAHRTHPRRLLEQARDTLADVNFHLRDVEATLQKLAAACRASPVADLPSHTEPTALLPF